MAETSVSSNNKSVKFGGKVEREMSSWNNKGITRSAAGKKPAGVANTAPMKKSKQFQKTAKRAIKRGMISEKAAKKYLGDD